MELLKVQQGQFHGIVEKCSWHTAAKVYQFLSWGLLDGVTEEDAKGYTKYLLLFFSAVAIGGLMEGGAI